MTRRAYEALGDPEEIFALRLTDGTGPRSARDLNRWNTHTHTHTRVQSTTVQLTPWSTQIHAGSNSRHG